MSENIDGTNGSDKKQSRQEKRVERNEDKFQKRETRKNNRAERLAAKKGFEGTQDEKIKQGRDLMSERRQKGRDFFINMAKAAGSGDSYTPRKRRSSEEVSKSSQEDSLKKEITEQTGTGSSNNIESIGKYNESVRIGDPGSGTKFTAAVNASKAIEGQDINLMSMGNEKRDSQGISDYSK